MENHWKSSHCQSNLKMMVRLARIVRADCVASRNHVVTYVRAECVKHVQTKADQVEHGKEQPKGEQNGAGVHVLLALVQGQQEGGDLVRKGRK